jgi:C_GCAxxG_C_C family probable redox protein
MDINIEERVGKAVALFKEGYNCSQSVVAAYADVYGFTKEQALKMSASFGAGIGRMRETRGAACGMFLLAGLETGCTDPKSAEGKGANYAVVQDLAAKFRDINGSIICAELLGLREKKDTGIGSPTQPQERNAEYFKKRPCVEMVRTAAQLFGEYLNTKN